jgi:hypothetical protein
MLGIALIVCSLFGEVPAWLAWAQRLGSWLFPGIALGVIALLVPLLVPSKTVQSSFFAFSPLVWASYISIVLVSISFEHSTLPDRIYTYCTSIQLEPDIVIPLYIVFAGLLGNLFDGVSIIAISIVIFLALLERSWAIRAAFALLFGSLISNLITVAAEPTNIKFQDVLQSLLSHSPSPFWLTNWPISLFGILTSSLWLAYWMRLEKVSWQVKDRDAIVDQTRSTTSEGIELALCLFALGLLGSGIIVHATLEAITTYEVIPLWQVLLPAGVLATIHLLFVQRHHSALLHIRRQWPVWGKLMLIFSLLWFLSNGLTEKVNILTAFFLWPHWVHYGFMIVLALLSSVTDNVAIAAMLGTIILSQPLPTWQIRLLLILLTWSGGFTPFGCLQSLALNNSIGLSTGSWFRATLLWALVALIGGCIGLVATILWYQ